MFSFALGIGTKDANGKWLEVYYPDPWFEPSEELLAPLLKALQYKGGNVTLEVPSVKVSILASQVKDPDIARLLGLLQEHHEPLVAVILAEDARPQSVPEVYLKLHLLSHRLVKPHQVNLEGMFSILPNVAWTNRGAMAIEELAIRQLEARLRGEIVDVISVDKFPKMTNYVVPTGVRIADTARVRLGAYIGEGTTIMHEGFVNFNAGTEGTAMIEGRISAGVFVGEHSDLGGGCSIMGTLSGGGTEVISVGKNCLIGANAGLGFPLGDRCTIEAGLYITANTKVTVMDNSLKPVEVVKARQLANKSDLLFLRNSVTGAVECRTNKSTVELNAELHSHN